MDIFEKIKTLNYECMDVVVALDGVLVLVGMENEQGCAMAAKIILEQLQELLARSTGGIDDIVKACQAVAGDSK